MATPFNEDGTLAVGDLQKFVERQISGGIQGLLPMGTTGESPTLNHEEHGEVVEIVVETAKGRLPVIAGSGSNSTREAISLTKHADAAGADGTLHVTGYYNKPTQEGIFQHFSAIAQETDKPIILYSIPGRCIVDISIATVERLLSKHPNIRHIKESGGEVSRVDELKSALGDDITVLSGDDPSLIVQFTISSRIPRAHSITRDNRSSSLSSNGRPPDGQVHEIRKPRSLLIQENKASWFDIVPRSQFGICYR